MKIPVEHLMTTEQLIAQIRRLDPTGKAKVVVGFGQVSGYYSFEFYHVQETELAMNVRNYPAKEDGPHMDYWGEYKSEFPRGTKKPVTAIVLGGTHG